jgi:opacity protein-like surface antigen
MSTITKCIFTAIITANLLAFPLNAQVPEKESMHYLSLAIGRVFPKSLNKNSDLYIAPKKGFSFEIGYGGYKLTNNIILGLILNYKPMAKISTNSNNRQTSFGYSSTAALINTTIRFPINEKFTQYIIGGIGVSRNTSSNYTYIQNNNNITTYQGSSKNNFAWHIGAGFEIASSDKWSNSFEYRYTYRGKAQTMNNGTIELLSLGISGITPNEAIKGRAQETAFIVGIKYHF